MRGERGTLSAINVDCDIDTIAKRLDGHCASEIVEVAKSAMKICVMNVRDVVTMKDFDIPLIGGAKLKKELWSHPRLFFCHLSAVKHGSLWTNGIWNLGTNSFTELKSNTLLVRRLISSLMENFNPFSLPLVS